MAGLFVKFKKAIPFVINIIIGIVTTKVVFKIWW